MDVKADFNSAALFSTGFEAEQYFRRKGYAEIGRRTNAAALARPRDNFIIRISEDAFGSSEFFLLAQSMQGNVYLPRVHGQRTLPSGDHIACVERLVSLSTRETYCRYKSIYQAQSEGRDVDPLDREWRERVDAAVEVGKKISMTFMNPDYHPDGFVLPKMEQYLTAAVALLDLAERVHSLDARYVPGPDMNMTNILFRQDDEGNLSPVLYDPLIKQSHAQAERCNVNAARSKFGLPPLGFGS